MTYKTQILAALNDEFSRWEELLARLSEEQITAPQQPGDWSIKDVVAHLRAGQQVSNARLKAASATRSQPSPTGWRD